MFSFKTVKTRKLQLHSPWLAGSFRCHLSAKQFARNSQNDFRISSMGGEKTSCVLVLFFFQLHSMGSLNLIGRNSVFLRLAAYRFYSNNSIPGRICKLRLTEGVSSVSSSGRTMFFNKYFNCLCCTRHGGVGVDVDAASSHQLVDYFLRNSTFGVFHLFENGI